MLKDRNLGVIGVSPHDSSDAVIDRIQREFGDRYRHIRVGEAIQLRAP